MASSKTLLAADLGASSGRLVAGQFDGEQLAIEEVHRFPNGPVVANDTMHWDALALWASIQDALREASKKYGDAISSVGIDTWGVDFALLGRDDVLLGNPVHYRDRRTQGMMDRAFDIVSREEIFAETGLQFMELNTLYQLLAMKTANSPLLEIAQSLLMMPDLFHWLLTGVKANESTDVSTTQCFNPQTQSWAKGMLEKFGIPTGMFGEIVAPGTRLGPLRRSVAEDVGLSGIEVILPGTHDTASAVMAVPCESPPSQTPNWCYISSGTWSLMGAETPRPIINDKCRELNFTNEGGVGGTVRLLKNIAGLWLIQECRRIWAQQGEDVTYTEMVEMAAGAAPLVSLIDPDDGRFVAPGDMPAAIAEYCVEKGQPAPQEKAAIVRCALESLAMRYRQVVNWLEELTGGRIETIHIVGGGANNRLLSQMTADATARRVVTGPTEATAVGNLMAQAQALGLVGSIGEARQVVRRSFDVQEFTPQDTAPWDEAFARFQSF